MNNSANNPSPIPDPPRGLSAILWRLPIWLYRIRLGRLLDHRSLLLNHVGRVSGSPRQAVLEVIKFDADSNTHYVASGFGEKANWYQNIVQTPRVSIRVAGKELPVLAERLPLSDAEIIFKDYHQRHPKALAGLGKMIGYKLSQNEAEILDFFSEEIPVIAFRPI
jgi:deazaflavin-dependent oxidoreductase (nitroreductase family)